jgi:hypothetical protein
MKTITDNLRISLLELLSVLLPGGTFLFFLNELGAFESFDLSQQKEWLTGIVYFGLAYFLGYVIYVLSSPLDGLYDKIKRKALKLDTKKGAKKELQLLSSNAIKCSFYNILFPHLVDTHNLIVKVVGFKNRDIGTDLDGYKHQIIDAYQYSYRRLMAEELTMFAEVERYFGTARFFRCMTIVLAIGAIIWLGKGEDLYQFCWIFGFSIVSFIIFLDRWRKANHVAFKNVIILEGLKKKQEVIK